MAGRPLYGLIHVCYVWRKASISAISADRGRRRLSARLNLIGTPLKLEAYITARCGGGGGLSNHSAGPGRRAGGPVSERGPRDPTPEAGTR